MPDLDPLPFIYFRQRYRSQETSAHHFEPRPGYSQNQDDYEE